MTEFSYSPWVPVIFIICVLLSAYFAATEISFMAFQKVRLRHLAGRGDECARRIDKILKKPGRFLATILLGNNLVNTAAASLGTYVAVTHLGSSGVLVATIVITTLLLVFGDFIPKSIAARHAERIAMKSVLFAEIMVFILTPFAMALNWFGSLFTRRLGERADKASITQEEIRSMITLGQEQGVVADSEAEMLHKIFEFRDRIVRDIMTQRTDMVGVDEETGIADFLKTFARYPYSRFPVYRDNPDNVVGTLWVKDVLMAQTRQSYSADSTIKSLMHQPYFVPETKRLNELFAEMQATGNQVAVAVDEFGTVSGMLTMRQLIEEIVGEMEDELARVSREYVTVDEHTTDIDAGIRIEDANEKLKLNIPEGDYETVAGFLLNILGHIPEKNEQVSWKGLRFKIANMRGMRIDRVRVTREETAEIPTENQV